MRYSLICGSLVLAALVADARMPAQSAAWCANYTFGGGMSCGFYTFEQCRSAIHGVGGTCMRNPAEPQSGEGQAAPKSRATTREQPAEPRQPREPRVKQSAPRPERVRERPVATTPSDESSPSGAATPARHEPPPVVAPPPETPPPRAAAAPAMLPQLDAPRSLTQPAQPSGTVAATSPAAQPADRFFLARDLILAGKYQAGLSAMQALDKGDNADVAAYVGLAHSKLGRTSDARTWYEKALVIDPNHLLTLAYFGMLRAEQGDVPSAQGYLEKIKGLCGGTGCYEYATLQAVISSKRR